MQHRPSPCSCIAANCDNKGPTISAYLTTNNGQRRVFGGCVLALAPHGSHCRSYTDVSWLSRSNYVTTYNAYLYRFNPGSDLLESVHITVSSCCGYNVRLNNSPTPPLTHILQNAMYDSSSYCPTYGCGHDLYGGNCQTGGYTNPCTYYQGSSASAYDQTFLGAAAAATSIPDHPQRARTARGPRWTSRCGI